MNAFEKFHAHHESLIRQIGSLGERAIMNPADASLLISYCNENLIPHAEAEEKVLYVEVEDEPLIRVMVGEHEEIKSKLAAIGDALSATDGEAIARECRGFLNLLNGHFDKEENKLIPILRLKYTDEDFLKLIGKVHEMENAMRRSDLGQLYEIDHRRIDFNIASFKNTSNGKENAYVYYKRFRDQILRHIELEENVLFPALSEYGDESSLESIGKFINGHRRFLSILSVRPASPDKIDELLRSLAVHGKAEEDVYPLVMRLLPSEKRRMIFKESFAGFSQV